MSLNANVTIKLLFFAIIPTILISCIGEAMDGKGDSNFSSLAVEQEFWDTWKSKRDNSPWPMEPFFKEGCRDLLMPVNERLIAISRASEVFVLILRVNSDNGVLEVISLVKNKTWKQIRWQDMGEGILEQSISKKQDVPEDVLKILSSKAIFVDTSDWQIDDADSVYVFLRYKGNYSRFAIYNPKFNSGKKTQRDPVADSLESLFQIAGIPAGIPNQRLYTTDAQEVYGVPTTGVKNLPSPNQSTDEADEEKRNH